MQLIKKLIMLKYKILVVGDRLNLSGTINYGYVDKKNLNYILQNTKYFISSNENLTNFFALDCINNDVKIITTIKYKKLNKKFNKNIIYLSQKNISIKKIEKILNF